MSAAKLSRFSSSSKHNLYLLLAEFFLVYAMDRNEPFYPAFRPILAPASARSAPSSKPKHFPLSQMLSQRENLDSIQPFSPRILSRNSKAGLLQEEADRPILFPALHRSHRSQSRPLQPPRTSAPFLDITNHFQDGHESLTHNSRPRADSQEIEIRSVSNEESYDSTTQDAKSDPEPPQRSQTRTMEPHEMSQSLQRIPLPCPPERPRSGSRPRSRQTSITAETRNEDADLPVSSSFKSSEFHELPHITLGAIRQVETLSESLKEQRRQNESLVLELNSVRSERENLKTANSSLRSELHSANQRARSTEEELASTLQECASLKDELIIAKKDLTRLQTELVSSDNTRAELVKELASVKEESDATRLQLGENKKRITRLRNGFDELNETFETLRRSQNDLIVSSDACKAMYEEVKDVRISVAEGLQAIQPLLDGNGNYGLAVEVRPVIRELQDDFAASQRVNDMLRDKLFHMSSQLAETQTRVKELEEGERNTLCELLKSVKERCGFDVEMNNIVKKIEDLSDSLLKREKESVDAMLGYVDLEQKFAVANKRLGELTEMITEKNKQLASLKNTETEKCDLERRVVDLTTKLTTTEESLRLASQQHLELRERANKHEKEVLVLKEENKALFESKNELLKHFDKAEREIHQLKDKYETELTEAKRDREEKDKLLRDAESRAAVLQERFDAQAITLRLTKEHSGDMQERLLTSETLAATKLASVTGKFELEVAVLKGHNDDLQCALNEAREHSSKWQAELDRARQDFNARMQEREAGTKHVAKLLEERAESAEREMAILRANFEDLTRVRKELEDKHCRDIVEAKEKEEKAVNALQRTIARLQQDKEDVLKKSTDIRARYDAGNLTDHEKEFVDWLVKTTSSFHENEAVSQVNKLKRRENLNAVLQAKVQELEVTIARLLKEKQESAFEHKSIADLSMWDTVNRAMPIQTVAPSALVTCDPSTTIVDTLTTTLDDRSATVLAHDVADCIAKNVIALNLESCTRGQGSPSGRVAENPKTFSELNGAAADDDMSELSDPEPLSVLGKRDRQEEKIAQGRKTSKMKAKTVASEVRDQPAAPTKKAPAKQTGKSKAKKGR